MGVYSMKQASVYSKPGYHNVVNHLLHYQYYQGSKIRCTWASRFATSIIPLCKYCQVIGLHYAVNLVCSGGKIWVDICPITT